MAIALGIATSTEVTSLAQARLEPTWIKDSIRHWCGLFIFINHQKIYLIHQTAKEFLMCDSDSPLPLAGWKHCLDPQGIERHMARICVEFLSLGETRLTALRLIERFKEYRPIDDFLAADDEIQSFLVYSAEHWPSHVRDADRQTNDSAMVKSLQLYAVDGAPHDIWFGIYWWTTRRHERKPRMTSVSLAAHLGHEQLLRLILPSTNEDEINECDQIDCNALM
jgi:hypothetical protein